MDKITNGYVKVPIGKELEVKADIQARFKALCFDDYGIKAKVKVKLIPISEITNEPTDFTHGYTVRCKG